jgi:hypothetical protein
MFGNIKTKLLLAIIAVIIIIIIIVTLIVICIMDFREPEQEQVTTTTTVQKQEENMRGGLRQQQPPVPFEQKQDAAMLNTVYSNNAVPQPQEKTIRFDMSAKGPIDNMSCVKIDRDVEDDNTYLCSSEDVGIKWSSTGPIDSMSCTRVDDQQDPYSWNDNYLCVPNNSSLALSMQYKRPVPNKSCVTWIDSPADSYRDTVDKYLCVDSADYKIEGA